MDRRYSESEVREILAKAIDDHSGTAARIDGLSLDEIKEIGAGVGVDAVAIERAARSLSAGAGVPSRFVGAPTVAHVERRIEGELGTVNRGELLTVIRRVMSKAGTFGDSSDLLEWRHAGELGHRVITVSSADGETTVSGVADLGQAAVLTYLPAGLAGLMVSVVGFITSAKDANELGMLLSVAVVPSVVLLTRRVFRWLSGSESAKIERVVDELCSVVERSRETT